MALVLRLHDQDSISLKLEDGRVIKVCIEIYSRFRTVAYIEADKSIRVDRIKAKESHDDSRNPSE